MTTYIALLRGINVGGSHKVPMADLRAVVADAGWEDVSTYIQSGNVVFRGPRRATSKVATDLEMALSDAFGVAIPVVVRTLPEWQAVIERQPFEGSGTQLHVVFVQERLLPGTAGGLDPDAFAPEAWALGEREVYLYLPDGMGRSKLARALNERALGAPGTARNWNTVTELAGVAAHLA